MLSLTNFRGSTKVHKVLAAAAALISYQTLSLPVTVFGIASPAPKQFQISPKIQWGQRSDMLFLTIQTPRCMGDDDDRFTKPNITSTSLAFECSVGAVDSTVSGSPSDSTSAATAKASSGTESSLSSSSSSSSQNLKTYRSDLTFLRPVKAGNAEITRLPQGWVHIKLPKARKEPCWKYLVRTKKSKKSKSKSKSSSSSHNSNPPSWLIKDFDQFRADDCQLQKELWRETYFRNKFALKQGQDMSSDSAEGRPIKDDIDIPRWDAAIRRMRDKAVPYDKIEPFEI